MTGYLETCGFQARRDQNNASRADYRSSGPGKRRFDAKTWIWYGGMSAEPLDDANCNQL